MTLPLLLLPLSLVQAQDRVELPRYDVFGQPLGILPAEGTDAHVFGAGLGLDDTPRAATFISGQLLADGGIRTFDRLLTLAPNVQMPSSFGHAATPNIRGDLTEIFTNDQRRTANAFGFKPSFNALEDLVVVRGPAPVVAGPGFYSGGYLNFLTKMPSFSGHFERLTLELGTWAPTTQSWMSGRVQLDSNHVFSRTTALRVSVEVQDDDTWYRRSGGRDDATDFYAALTQLLPEGRWTLILQHQWQAAPQTVGVNRVTQNLISHHLYLRGGVSDPRDFTERPSGPELPWQRGNVIMSTGDLSNANILFAQSLLSLRAGDGELKNSTFAEVVNRKRHNQWEYSEYAKQVTVENRTEWSREADGITSLLGATGRYEWRRAYTNYSNILFNAFDILDGTHHYSAPKAFPEHMVQGTPGPDGRLFFGPTDWVPETSASTLLNGALFAQQKYRRGAVQWLYGARGDYYAVEAHDPLQHLVRDHAQFGSASYNTSLLWKPVGHWTGYATYNRTSAVNASVSGAAITQDPYDGFRIAAANFHSRSDLWEAGVRSTAKETQFSLAAFWQDRQQNNFYTNAPSDISVRGVEAECVRAWGNWYGSANLVYLEGNYRNSWPFEYAGIGSPTVDGPGDYRMPGLSRWYANATVGCTLSPAWKAQIQVRWQDDQAGDLSGALRIPAQYSGDATITYTHRRLTAQLGVMNLTDRRNWVHNGDPYADNLFIGEELPLRFVLRLTLAFK